MTTDGAETRNYGVDHREYTPQPMKRTDWGRFPKERRMQYAKTRLQDCFARTGNMACSVKAKELSKLWPVQY